jgi:hypothetical protein
MQVGGRTGLADTGYIGYVSLYFASSRVGGPSGCIVLSFLRFRPAVAAENSRLELLIGNERWLSPSTFVPAFSHRRDLGERGCVLCVDAEIDVDALESAFTFCIQVEGYPRL